MVSHKYTPPPPCIFVQSLAEVHCKNIWVTSTIFRSSQLHACCMRDTLQTSMGCFLFESKRVLEKPLPQLGSSYRNPIVFTYSLDISITAMQPRHSSRGSCVGSKKHYPHQKCNKPLKGDTNLTKGKVPQLHSDSE